MPPSGSAILFLLLTSVLLLGLVFVYEATNKLECCPIPRDKPIAVGLPGADMEVYNSAGFWGCGLRASAAA